jgi:hypothetical protein
MAPDTAKQFDSLADLLRSLGDSEGADRLDAIDAAAKRDDLDTALSELSYELEDAGKTEQAALLRGAAQRLFVAECVVRTLRERVAELESVDHAKPSNGAL